MIYRRPGFGALQCTLMDTMDRDFGALHKVTGVKVKPEIGFVVVDSNWCPSRGGRGVTCQPGYGKLFLIDALKGPLG